MVDDILAELSKMKIDQLGYVYKDAEKQAKIMEEMYGMPKFAFIGDGAAHPIIYRGEEIDYAAKIGISRFFNTQIELIEPLKGQSSHTEFLDKDREGLQHISMFVDDIDPYVKALTDKGIEIIQSGQIGKRRFVYLDTEETFGIVIEIQMTVKRQRKKK